MIDLHAKLATTVVGSFPLSDSEENMKRAIDSQIEANIDYITYGQLKDMNTMFLEPLIDLDIGIKKIDDQYWIVDELKSINTPITVEYLDFLKSYTKNNTKLEGHKVQITGAITLSSILKLSNDSFAIEYDDFLLSIASIVAKIAQFYDESGVDIISIDEPSLSYAMWLGKERDLLIDCINREGSAIKKSCKGMHVCGSILGITDLLLETNVTYLDHEFIAHPKNMEEYTKSDLEKYDKILGLGSVKTTFSPLDLLKYKEGKISRENIVESKNEIKKHVKQGIDQFGIENLLIDPDCGFGGLKNYLDEEAAQTIAFLKMKNMSDAVFEIKKENKITSV